MRVGIYLSVSVLVAVTGYFQGETETPIARPVSDVVADVVAGGVPDGVPVLRAGSASLMFPVSPAPGTAPVMPDWPWALHQMAPDTPPRIETRAPNRLISIGSVEFTATDSATEPARDPESPLHRVTAVSLNMRSGPSNQFPPIAILRQGARALVSGRASDGWVRIELIDTGRRGWVFQRYLAPLDP